jgi:hypothetical protein
VKRGLGLVYPRICELEFDSLLLAYGPENGVHNDTSCSGLAAIDCRLWAHVWLASRVCLYERSFLVARMAASRNSCSRGSLNKWYPARFMA